MTDRTFNILIVIVGLFINFTIGISENSLVTYGDKCMANQECINSLVCVNGVCGRVDCGPNSNRKVVNNTVLCVCNPGFKHVNNTCKPINEKRCFLNTDCGPRSTCICNACSRPCKQIPMCYCTQQDNPHPVIGPTCSSHNDCKNNLACIDQTCIDPCIGRNCGANAICQVDDHIPSCVCKAGFVYINMICEPISIKLCSSDADCDLRSACIANVCKNPCLTNPCEANAICTIVIHSPVCNCIPGFQFINGSCIRQENPPVLCGPTCSSHQECDNNLSCINQVCMDPCIEGMCGANFTCNVDDHIPLCTCKPGYEYDGTNCRPSCKICSSDADCDSRSGCIDNVCKNPCHVPKKCHHKTNTMCIIHRHVGNCYCTPGFYFNRKLAYCHSKSNHANYTGPKCSSNEECDNKLACMRKMCLDPCHEHECGPRHLCSVEDHIPLCYCKRGTYEYGRRCYPIKKCKPGSRDCDGYFTCIDNFCRHPCHNITCNDPAVCTFQGHNAYCTCGPGLELKNGKCQPTENPPKLTANECSSNKGCDEERACVGGICVDPCIDQCPGCQVIDHARWCKG